MNLKFNFYFLIILFTNFCNAQTNSVFENKEKDSKAKINLNISDLTNGNSKTLVFGAIFSPIITNYETYDQNWLLPYHSNKIQAKFYVYPNIDNTGVIFNFEKGDSVENFQSSQSMIIIISNDTSVINFLNNNRSELSIVEHSKKNFFSIFKLINITGYKEFQKKTNKIFHFIDNFETNEINLEQTILNIDSKSFFVEALYKNSIFNNSNEVGFFTIKKINPTNKLNFNIGVGFSRNNFSYQSTLNSLSRQESLYNLSLDSIYCKLDNLNEDFKFNSILFKGIFGLNYDINKKNTISIELVPFFSISSNSNSKVKSGTVSTYGFYHQINEYLFNIPEFNLLNNSDNILGTVNYYKTQQLGLDINLSFNIKLNQFSFKPFVNFQILNIKNKNTLQDFYSFDNFRYNGGFSTKKYQNYYSPYLGVSFLF